MQFKRARFPVALLVALCLLTFGIACSKDEDEEDSDSGDANTAQVENLTPYKTSGKEGSIVGAISFNGTAPAPKTISMDQDPVCASTNPSATAEDIVVKDGKLENVFVYIRDGKTADQKSITGFSFDTPAQAAVLDQHGCHYVPHILGMQTKQSLEIKNSDATSHNVNVLAAKNEKFNQGQGPGAAPLDKKFLRSEILIPVKCNQHPWMRSYIGVLSHPFFAVSGADGKFEIKGVPPGTYTVVAWHEKYPQGVTQTVTVGANENKQQDFSFNADQLKAELTDGALKVMPALEFPMVGHAGNQH
ncbi:MAG: carboxypeptidase regulatory-like domain-containing protein [Pyrinomonadaceae bacterium]